MKKLIVQVTGMEEAEIEVSPAFYASIMDPEEGCSTEELDEMMEVAERVGYNEREWVSTVITDADTDEELIRID